MKVLCVIPARYASTRLPGKPLSLIAGKPMIQHVYERACQAKLPDEVVVATDNELVKKAVDGFGGKAMMTSPDHPSGTDRLAEVLAPIEIKDITVPVVANVTAQEVTSGEEIKKLLVKQAAMPVLWETSVRNMVAGGVDIFVEVGPGKVLTGFTKKIAKGMMALNVEDAASLEKTLAELNK